MERPVCLGKKLAFADIFLIVVNLLRQTSGYELALPDGPGTANLTPGMSRTNNCYYQ